MYRGKRILTLISARAGSKGIRMKNIKLLRGKPLIAYSIEQARALDWIDRLIVSTDSPKIQTVARQYGAETPFLRPKYLATDTAPTIPVLIHAIKKIEQLEKRQYDIIIHLEPPSPIRTPQDIQNCVDLLLENPDVTSVLSVVEADRNPYFNMVELDANGYAHISKKTKRPITRRQHAPKVYAMNASIYVMKKEALLKQKTFFMKKTKIYLMDPLSRFDIDCQIDFEIVEMLLKKRGKK